MSFRTKAGPVHAEPSELAGKTVRIKADVRHPQVPDFAGSEFEVEDWWDRLSGKRWGDANGNPACLIYAIRTAVQYGEDACTDDEVLYGKVGPYGHLVHIDEIEPIEGEK